MSYSPPRWFNVAAALSIAAATIGIAWRADEVAAVQADTHNRAEDGDRAKAIAKRFGGTDCDPHYLKSPWTISEDVGTPLFLCAFSRHGGLDFIGLSNPHVTQGAPLLLASPANRRILGVVVFLVGGPGEKFLAPPLDNPANEAILDLARAGYVVAYVGYSGTRYGTVYPVPDLPIASAQIKNYLMFLKRAAPELPLSLVGASAGAHPAYLGGQTVKGVQTVLLSPLFYSPASYFEAVIRKPDEAFWWKSLRLLRIQPGWRGLATDWYLKSVSNRDRIMNFYGTTYRRSMADMIAKFPLGPGVDVDVIVGTLDSRIGVHEIAGLATRYGSLCFRLVSGSEHSVTSSTQARRITTALATSLKSHGSKCASREALARQFRGSSGDTIPN